MPDLEKNGEDVGMELLALSASDEDKKLVRPGEALQSFPGGPGQRFENCVRQMTARGARDPRALCAFIGRRAGKIP